MTNKINNIKTNVEFFEEGHVYKIGNEEFPSVTSIIKRVYPMGVIDNLKILDYARDRGTYVHAVLETLESNNGADLKAKEILKDKYEEHEFSTWTKMAEDGISELNRIYPGKTDVVTELPLAHTELKYAGTFDQIFNYGDKIVLVDFKTSSHMKNNRYNNLDKVKMQMAAYSLILKDVFGVEVNNVEVLHMTKYGIELIDIKPDFEGFKKALELPVVEDEQNN